MFEQENPTVLAKKYQLYSSGNTAVKVDEDDNKDNDEYIFSKKRKMEQEMKETPAGQITRICLPVMFTLAFKTVITDCNIPEDIVETSGKG